MAITQIANLPQQFKQDLQQDYARQLTGLTSVPLDTSRFEPTVAAQDPLQTQAASLAGSGVGAYQPYLTQAGTYGTQAGTTMGGVSPYISTAAGLTGTGAGTGAGSIRSIPRNVFGTHASQSDSCIHRWCPTIWHRTQVHYRCCHSQERSGEEDTTRNDGSIGGRASQGDVWREDRC